MYQFLPHKFKHESPRRQYQISSDQIKVKQRQQWIPPRSKNNFWIRKRKARYGNDKPRGKIWYLLTSEHSRHEALCKGRHQHEWIYLGTLRKEIKERWKPRDEVWVRRICVSIFLE